MAASQVVLTESLKPPCANLGRRFTAHTIDLLLIFLLLLLTGVTMRTLRILGLWSPAGAGVTPEELWRGLGVGPKLLAVLAWFISMDPPISSSLRLRRGRRPSGNGSWESMLPMKLETA